MIRVYGAAGSGSVAVEAALHLLNISYELVEGATWMDANARDRVANANPMRQVPTVVLDDGEVMTEAGAILTHLADANPDARLAPKPDEAARRPYLRWMYFISGSIYSLYWVKADPTRIGCAPRERDGIVERLHERIASCWSMMDSQVNPKRYILGDDLSVLDLYVTVVSRFGPWRRRFYKAAPKMAHVVKRIDADPRLADFWSRRFPFEEGWEA